MRKVSRKNKQVEVKKFQGRINKSRGKNKKYQEKIDQ